MNVKNINAFPEYEMRIEKDARGQNRYKNFYRGIEIGRGGYIYSEPGVYENIALLDSESHHPVSAIMLNYMGEYTPRFKELLDARLAIKHGDYEKASKMFDGKLAKYLTDPKQAKNLSNALKTAINSVYGITAASFENPFYNKHNVNNIVALRGAIFLKLLQDAVVEKGYKVISVRTDSIKIPNATPEIIKFVQDLGHEYGYNFEFECAYSKLCLINDTDYVARFMSVNDCQRLFGTVPKENREDEGKWTSTGAQFSRPIVFKSLFTKEQIVLEDLREIKEAQNDMYLDINEGLPDVSLYEAEMMERAKADTVKSKKLNPELSHLNDEQLKELIRPGHDYKFIGKVGAFIPMIDGVGAGELVVFRNGKPSAVNGTKGYRWMDFEMVKGTELERKVDIRYHRSLVDGMRAAIEKYCDFEWFVSDDSMPQSDYPPDEDKSIPWYMPCKDPTKTVCEDCQDRDHCPHYQAELQQQAELASFQRR